MKKIFVFLLLIGAFYAQRAFAGAWTLPKGKLWLKSALYYQSTSSRFCTEQDSRSLSFQGAGCNAAGHSAPIDPFSGGEINAMAVYTEAVYGVNGWIDIGLKIPFYSLKFTNVSNPNRPTNTSFGDIRFFSKVKLMENPVVASVKFEAKSPTGQFDIDAEAINVSEGQWDYELSADFGKSLWPIPGYFNIGLGYRIRTDNEDFEFTFGNEFIALIEAGLNISKSVMIKGTMDWLRGESPVVRFNGNKLLWSRELLTIAPTILYNFYDNIQLEAGVSFPIKGRDFPDGPHYITSISYDFSLFQ